MKLRQKVEMGIAPAATPGVEEKAGESGNVSAIIGWRTGEASDHRRPCFLG